MHLFRLFGINSWHTVGKRQENMRSRLTFDHKSKISNPPELHVSMEKKKNLQPEVVVVVVVNHINPHCGKCVAVFWLQILRGNFPAPEVPSWST